MTNRTVRPHTPSATPLEALIAFQITETKAKNTTSDNAFNVLGKQIRRVIKLMRLALRNASAGEAQAAIHQAQKLIAQLDAVAMEPGRRS